MSDEPQPQPQRFKPIEALPYETPRSPSPGKRIGLVMMIGFALLGISVFPMGFMLATVDHGGSAEQTAAVFMGVVAAMLILAGLSLIMTAAWHMLRD